MIDWTNFLLEDSEIFFNRSGLFYATIINFGLAFIPMYLMLRLQGIKSENKTINHITNSVIGMNFAIALRFLITGIDTFILYISYGKKNLLAAWEYIPWFLIFITSTKQVSTLIRVPKIREWRIDRITKMIYGVSIIMLLTAVVNILRLSNLILFTGVLTTIMVMIPVLILLHREKNDNTSMMMKSRLDLTLKAWWFIVSHVASLFVILIISVFSPEQILTNPIYAISYNFIPGMFLAFSAVFFYWSLILPDHIRKKYGLNPPEDMQF